MNSEKNKAEIGALSVLRDKPGVAVILNELDRHAAGSRKTVPLDEVNWELKAAHAAGYSDAMGDFKTWLLCRLTGHITDDGEAVLGRLKLSERKRKE